MRVDNAAAKTWLLGALALWALCVWVLGLAGMGGRVERLANDPALLQALPQLPTSPPDRLGAMTQYAAISQRPLFTEDRKPQPYFIDPEGGGEGKDRFDFVLSSVLLTTQLRMAILTPADGGQPVRLKVGEAPDAAPSWTLSALEARSAVFTGPEGPRTLELRLFQGAGGIVSPTMAPTTPPNRPNMPQPEPQPPPRPPAATASDNQPPPPLPPLSATDEPAQASPAAQADQIEAIRSRIEARREKLRQQSQPAPLPPPPPAHGQTP